MRGEPIVCTAVDALICFVRSNIDFLVIEDFIIGRAGIPILWEIMATQGGQRRKLGEGEEVGHLVYTLL
jgi:carbamoyltransferase